MIIWKGFYGIITAAFYALRVQVLRESDGLREFSLIRDICTMIKNEL